MERPGVGLTPAKILTLSDEAFLQLCEQHNLRFGSDLFNSTRELPASSKIIGVYLRGSNGPTLALQGHLGAGVALVRMPEEHRRMVTRPPTQIGLDRKGWFHLRHWVVGPVDAVMESFWLALTVGDPVQEVPPHMVLEEYDFGHRVVVLEGERLAYTGAVTGVFAGSLGLADGTSHRTESLAVVRRPGADWELAPLRHRLPPGSPVWALVEGVWEAAVVGEYELAAQVHLWLVERDMAWRMARHRLQILARNDDTAPPSPRRPVSFRDVPPARRGAMSVPGKRRPWVVIDDI